MKFSFLKFNKDKIPPLSRVRPNLFNAYSRWTLLLLIFLLALVVSGFVSFKLFYSVYTESFKKDIKSSIPDNLIDTAKLSSVVKERSDFTNSTTTIPANPFR